MSGLMAASILVLGSILTKKAKNAKVYGKMAKELNGYEL